MTGSGRSPTSRRPTVSIGFCVAERPTRWGRVSHRASSRSSVIARCAPRLSRATAWISSTMTVSTVRQRVAALGAGDEQVERLRGGDDEARWLAHHRGALRARGVAGAHGDAHVRCAEPELGRDLGDLGQRPFEVLRDVDRERLERRHVDDARDAVDLLAAFVRAVQAVDAHEEAGEGLARPGGRGDQRVVPGRDLRPTLLAAARSARRGTGAGTTPRPRDGTEPAPGAPGGPAGSSGSGTAVIHPFSRMGTTRMRARPPRGGIRTGRRSHPGDARPRSRTSGTS